MSGILIFGANGGVGRAIAVRMSRAGQPVTLAARQSQRLYDLPVLAAATLVECDVLDSDQIAQAIATASADGLLHGLAFCVGSIPLAPLKRQTRDGLLAAVNLHAASAMEAIRLAEAPLRAANGSVVLFSTIAVGQGFANHAAVSAAKGAVEGLTRALAADLAPQVRVNCIAPSLMDTQMARVLTSNEAMAKGIAAMHPIARLGAADDAAALAAFLLGSESGWVTGQVWGVDGGRSHVRTKG